MEFKHTSVMFNEVIDNLLIKPNGIYVDGTLGGGGHSAGICEQLDESGTLIAIDRDTDAINASKSKLQRYVCDKKYVHSNYCNIKKVLRELGIKEIQGAVLDLGVSSYQLDNEKRGFSYMKEAPLDMRMDQSDELTAHNIINDYTEEDIYQIIKTYGEEKWASRIANFIVQAREKTSINTTTQLVDIIKSAIPASARRTGPHPAKRTFQAIRIEVNNELQLLKDSVNDFIDVLSYGGRLCIITFHSLEDRIVKRCFNDAVKSCTCPPEIPICVCGGKAKGKKVTSKPIIPTEDEIDNNPRSRSAKLRVIEKV